VPVDVTGGPPEESDRPGLQLMANPEYLAILNQGVEPWNKWRREGEPGAQPGQRVDLNEANLTKAKLAGANLRRVSLARAAIYSADLRSADLFRANLGGANLNRADLSHATLTEAQMPGVNLQSALLCQTNLSNADLSEAYLNGADLSGSDLTGTDLTRASLYEAKLCATKLNSAKLNWSNMTGADLRNASLPGANLTGVSFIEADLPHADLSGANLRYARLADSNLEAAKLTGCRVYGASAWNLNLSNADQWGLIVTRPDEPTITTDSLDVAQFIHLLLNNRKVREVLDTITSKVVLILGRFTPERKAILDAIGEELRSRNYLPVLFDFEKPSSRDITEAVSTLAHMARFIIADITDARSVPQELERIVPDLPSVPVQPLLLDSQHEYGMFEHFQRYPWVLEPVLYHSVSTLLGSLVSAVIAPAEAKSREQTGRTPM